MTSPPIFFFKYKIKGGKSPSMDVIVLVWSPQWKRSSYTTVNMNHPGYLPTPYYRISCHFVIEFTFTGSSHSTTIIKKMLTMSPSYSASRPIFLGGPKFPPPKFLRLISQIPLHFPCRKFPQNFKFFPIQKWGKKN